MGGMWTSVCPVLSQVFLECVTYGFFIAPEHANARTARCCVDYARMVWPRMTKVGMLLTQLVEKIVSKGSATPITRGRDPASHISQNPFFILKVHYIQHIQRSCADDGVDFNDAFVCEGDGLGCFKCSPSFWCLKPKTTQQNHSARYGDHWLIRTGIYNRYFQKLS